jgi:folate-dependent phosphoribosylglycinamide formyltransferase PurN
MKWTALFSHTGTEILNISTRLNRKPDLVITNNQPGGDVNVEFGKIQELLYVNSKPESVDYMSFFDSSDIVTLHGWMRVIPPDICKQFKIYNLHPGLITVYPELRGKDPQSRVINTQTTYDSIGCVIHEVTEEVDGGRVLMERSVNNHYYSTQRVTEKLHEIATDMWVDFLVDKL